MRLLGFVATAALVAGMAGCGNDFAVPVRDGGGGGDGGMTGDGGTPGDGGAPACSVLAEAECTQRSDCTADYCQGCTCGLNFAGCRANAAGRTPCPALGCPQPICGCHNDSECTGGIGFETCSPPGATLCGGACRIPLDTCMNDSDCANTTGGPFICEPVPCACSPDRECVPGCKDSSDCQTGFECGPDARCVPQSCAGVACPPNFACTTTGTEKRCSRKTCTSDAGCGGGYCVNGACYGELGECHGPQP